MFVVNSIPEFQKEAKSTFRIICQLPLVISISIVFLV